MFKSGAGRIFNGTGWLSPTDNPGINDPVLARGASDAHWDLLAVMLSYRF